MMFIAFAIECFAEVERLLPGPELNLNGPPRSINPGKLGDGEILLLQVGQHDVPPVPDQGFLAGLFSLDTGFLTTLSPTSSCDRLLGPDGNEPTFFTLSTDGGLKIENVVFRGFEELFQSFAAFQRDVRGEWKSGQPPRIELFNDAEFLDDKISHVAQDKVPGFDFQEGFLADELILLSCWLEAVGDDLPGDQIVGEVDFHPGGGSVMVAVGGEIFGIGFGHDLGRGILDDEAFDRAVFQNLPGGLVALTRKVAENAKQEGGGFVAETLMHGLDRHGNGDAIFEVVGNLVQRGEAGDYGFEKGL